MKKILYKKKRSKNTKLIDVLKIRWVSINNLTTLINDFFEIVLTHFKTTSKTNCQKNNESFLYCQISLNTSKSRTFTRVLKSKKFLINFLKSLSNKLYFFKKFNILIWVSTIICS